ncbi:MAG: periplasmic heavy metal sensor [Myxococcaceae bacterium]
MFGFFAGAVGAYVVYRIVRRRRWRNGGWGMRWVFNRLQTSEAQERVLREAVEAFRAAMNPLREEWGGTRSVLASAMGQETLDAAAAEAMWQRHDGVLGEARKAFWEAAKKVHATLDATQRNTLAQMLERAPRHAGRWGMYGHRYGAC